MALYTIEAACIRCECDGPCKGYPDEVVEVVSDRLVDDKDMQGVVVGRGVLDVLSVTDPEDLTFNEIEDLIQALGTNI